MKVEDSNQAVPQAQQQSTNSSLSDLALEAEHSPVQSLDQDQLQGQGQPLPLGQGLGFAQSEGLSGSESSMDLDDDDERLSNDFDPDAYFKERILADVFSSSSDDFDHYDSSYSKYNKDDFFAPDPDFYDEQPDYAAYQEYMNAQGGNVPETATQKNKAVRELVNYFQQKEFAQRSSLSASAAQRDLAGDSEGGGADVGVLEEQGATNQFEAGRSIRASQAVIEHNQAVREGNKPVLPFKLEENSAVELKEQLRFMLSKYCYSPAEIYGEPSYFEPSAVSPLAQISFGWGYYDLSSSLKERAYQCRLINRMDIAFIDYLARHYPLGNDYDQQVFDLVLLSLFSHMDEGDICINLGSLDDICQTILDWTIKSKDLEQREGDNNYLNELIEQAKFFVPDSVASLQKIVARAICVGTKDEVNSPLVYDCNRLYLRRYFNYELEVANYIKHVAKISFDEDKLAKLRKLIGLLFPYYDGDGVVNWQKVAAVMSSTSKFSVISGGPGTGKTTTVLRIILMLICLDSANKKILMCAPTGKAAARMGESIAKQLKDDRTKATLDKLSEAFALTPDYIRSLIPTEAVTVHRLIKTNPNRATPIYNRDNQLSCDVLVVDEVSMLDLALFAKLIAALPSHCQLILLGDKDQLSSVEAGKVLADLCYSLDSTAKDRVDSQTLAFIEDISGYSADDLLAGKIADNVSLLQFSYRSKDVPQIGNLAKLVNAPLNPNADGNWGLSDDFPYENIVFYLETKLEQMGYGQFDEQEFTSSLSELVNARTQAVMEQFANDEGQALSLKLFKPKVMGSNVEAHKSAFNRPNDGAEDFCRSFAKSCVARGGKDNYAPFLEYLEQHDFTVSSDPKELEKIFKLMDLYRVLCSNHSGEFGDKKLNELIENEVRRTYLKQYNFYDADDFYPGQIVLITKNSKEQSFVNGDVGFCAFVDDSNSADEQSMLASSEQLSSSDADSTSTTQVGSLANARGQKRAAYGKKRKLKVIIPSGVVEENGESHMSFTITSTMMLTDYDTGFAMSIHKSQGSEYDRVSIMLSKNPNKVLNKELVYTGITRAKKRVDLLTSLSSLSYALGNCVQRRSGLAERLYAKDQAS